MHFIKQGLQMTLHEWTALVGAIAWPVTILIIVVLLRRELVRLIGRVRELEGPGNVKLAFDSQKIEEVLEEVKRGTATSKALAARLEKSLRQPHRQHHRTRKRADFPV